MSVSEYEERFRPWAPSLHQVFTMAGGQRRKRVLRGRIGVAAAALGVVIVTCRIASPYTLDAWSGGRSRTTACQAQKPRTVSHEFGFPLTEPALDIQQPTERINGHKSPDQTAV
jgi:hypothetical protein